MVDTDSDDFDSRFDDLRESFEGAKTEDVIEAAERVGLESDAASGEFESGQLQFHTEFAENAENQVAAAQMRQADFDRRAAGLESEGNSLQLAEHKMSQLHDQADTKTLLDRSRFGTDE